MSEGPISRWRDSYKPPRSMSQAQALHLWASPGRAACGRRVPASKFAVPPSGEVTCADCLATTHAEGR